MRSTILKKVPNPVPVDEIKIIEADVANKKQKKKTAPAGEPYDWLNILWFALGSIAVLLIAALSAPAVIWMYFHKKAKQNTDLRKSAFAKYNAATVLSQPVGLIAVRCRVRSNLPSKPMSSLEQILPVSAISTRR